ncbi:hypothetical protein [Mycoplasmopsis edwardii]|uniref:Uncharacterized protein n=1 Tax=Mycoplasmopsis edwardii TaxID=53558 RepID=A0ACD4PJM4_9BACT|nr:hypothetical protein [Mycoplasmopsis edwardii]WBP83891.1 hypothetical protein Me_995_000517 [Mycoplasmopsis edwardii]
MKIKKLLSTFTLLSASSMFVTTVSCGVSKEVSDEPEKPNVVLRDPIVEVNPAPAKPVAEPDKDVNEGSKNNESNSNSKPSETTNKPTTEPPSTPSNEQGNNDSQGQPSSPSNTNENNNSNNASSEEKVRITDIIQRPENNVDNFILTLVLSKDINDEAERFKFKLFLNPTPEDAEEPGYYNPQTTWNNRFGYPKNTIYFDVYGLEENTDYNIVKVQYGDEILELVNGKTHIRINSADSTSNNDNENNNESEENSEPKNTTDNNAASNDANDDLNNNPNSNSSNAEETPQTNPSTNQTSEDITITNFEIQKGSRREYANLYVTFSREFENDDLNNFQLYLNPTPEDAADLEGFYKLEPNWNNRARQDKKVVLFYIYGLEEGQTYNIDRILYNSKVITSTVDKPTLNVTAIHGEE